ncbi:acyltransferase family protein [Mucilaginibacter sp.]|uniref:acyltransferase family protein n=1 Tax=Mucilaginibacter sp. TaxID=1882438 RepID=UPI002636F924|nr:acyltransferase family protein [Mucilaginibacter sp.]MDB5129108.1 acyltransferase family protein [Mucilaginibacter sp.]
METTQRQTYLDWLRIISIAGVLIFHSGMPYAANEWWHIRNHDTSALMSQSNYFMHLVRMPLLFFISGTVSYYMMQRRSALSFIKLRFTRLFIPLLVGMFIIVPPQIYMERVSQGFTGNYWDFYKTTFTTGAYPKGNLSWHHLWFIAYLFVYDLVFAPVFMWLISDKSRGFKRALNGLSKGKWVYVLAVPSIVWYACLSWALPQTSNLIHDYCFIVYWLLFLLAGFICILQPSLMESLQRNRRFAITIGFISILAVNYLWLNPPPNDGDWSALRGYSFRALSAIVGWSWVLGLVGYGKQYLNRFHPALNYLNQAVYPFYILHQTVIVILAYYIVRTTDTVLMKYIYTIGVTLFITMGIYHLLVKPYPVMRFLFGMKGLEKKAGKIPVVSELEIKKDIKEEVGVLV